MNSAIIIKTSEGEVIVPVSNLSKEAKLEAIAKTLGVPQSNLQEVATTSTQGVYALINLVPMAVKLGGCAGTGEEYFASFIVNYVKLKE